MTKISKIKKIKVINEPVNTEIREQVNDVILTTPTIKTEVVVPVLEDNIVIPEESLPNVIHENNLVGVDYDNPLEEETDVESTGEDNKVIAQAVINKRPSRGKKGLVETIDVIAQEVKILEQLIKDSNKRISSFKKSLLEFCRELRASKIKS
jgi:hypothetical protein